MAAISKNVYFDVIDDIVNKYNNTVHKTIKMKPIDVMGDSYAEYNENPNKKDHVNDPTLKSCLFGVVTLTKNAHIDNYGYSGYGIGFDRRGSFPFPGVDMVKMY